MLRPRGCSTAATAHPACAATYVNAPEWASLGRDQLIAEPLMVPLPMVVRHDLVEGAEQATFPEEEAIRVFEQLGLQRGSHIRLRHATDRSRKPLTIPDHRTLKSGLLPHLMGTRWLIPRNSADG
jgi:predicted RNA binding protein YcfA (HicA-like mRNA interferase family)